METESAFIKFTVGQAALLFGQHGQRPVSRRIQAQVFLSPLQKLVELNGESLSNANWTATFVEADIYNEEAGKRGEIGYLRRDGSLSVALKSEAFQSLLHLLDVNKSIDLSIEVKDLRHEGYEQIVWNTEAPDAPIVEASLHSVVSSPIQKSAPAASSVAHHGLLWFLLAAIGAAAATWLFR